MRVLNVLFEDRYGGPQKRVIDVAKVLSAYGVETILCLPEGDGNTADIARKSGVEVRCINFERIPRLSNLGRVLRWIFYLPRDVWRFVTLFRREKPDKVHVNGAFFITPALAARLVNIPLVWHLNDTILPERIAAAFSIIVRLLANQIVVSAEAVAVYYRVSSIYHEVIYPPVDIKKYSFASRLTKERNRKVFRIGLIANWNPIKGVEYFVQAASLVWKRLGSKLEVVFAGARLSNQAEYARRVDNLINELGLKPIVREYGFVTSVLDVLAELDVLVLSSTSEAFGMTILEGMTVGVPVVATNVGGLPELVTGDPMHPAGILVPPRNPEAMAEAILELLKDPDRAARMGQNGRRLAEERFSLEMCVERHLMVYTNSKE